MKPLRLEMHAFGPYAGEQVVDFRALGDRRLMLIHGPTGAGKSSILDAICFALYGESSGDERQASEMRCDMADREVLTRVTFDFAMGRDRLRITREPKQQRPARRGHRMVEHQPHATLWRIAGGELSADFDEDQAEVVATGTSDVTVAVTERLGFEGKQFRQVVMLPQGQFRRLLTAGTKEREAILRTLFQTQQYQDVTRRLAERERELYREVAQHLELARAQLASVEVESREALDLRLEESRTQLATVEAQIEPARQVRDAARETVQAREEAERRAAVLEQAEQAVRAIEARAPEVAGLEARHAAGQRARPLLVQRAAAEDRRREQVEAALAADRHAGALKAAERRSAAAEAAAKAERARDAERDAAARELSTLEQLRESAARLDQAREEHASAEARMAEARKRVESTEQRIEARRARLQADTEAREAARAEAGTLETARAEVERLGRLEDRLGDLAELETRRASRQRDLEQARKDTEEADAGRREAAALLEGLGARWRSGHAGALARELQPGEACPVCGSTEHPAPAHAPEDLPTEAELERARDRAEAAARKRDVLVERRAEAERAEAELRGRIESIRAELGDGDGGAREVAVALQEARKRANAAMKAADRVEALEPTIEGHARALEAEGVELAEARTALEIASSKRGGTEEAVASLERTLPPALRDPGALERALSVAAARRAHLVHELEHAEKAEADAREALSAATAADEAARKVLAEAETRADAAIQALARAREDAQLADDEAFAAAVHDAADLDRLEEQVRAHRKALTEAETRRSEARAQAEQLRVPPEAPPLDDLKARVAEAEKTHAELLRQQGELGEAIKSLTTVARRHADTLGASERAEAAYHRVALVAKVAGGTNERQISFERYVLAALLDDVVRDASVRLQHMSHGRFELVRTDQVRRRNSPAGLDLHVLDAYSGQTRPAHTLSGGESFLAALALSLGLSDVVQAYSGGVRLDALFIDEGFGTLDPASLDRALDVLTELAGEGGGGRLIAIISHVQDLEQRIDTRLRVDRSEVGSHARLTVG